MLMQEKLNKSGLEYIAGLAAASARLWELACAEEGIPADTVFAVFGDDNRAARLLNQVRRQLVEARGQYAAGGYVGLSMGRGRPAEMHRRRRAPRRK